MMTFEMILEVFADYLCKDKDYEVVLTSRGYAVMGWDDGQNNWNTVEHCATPQALRDHLLDAFCGFMALEMTGGDRPLTDAEERKIEAAQQEMVNRCQ